MKALCRHGTHGDVRCRQRPRDPQRHRGWSRRHHQGDELRDLRFGPSPDGWPDADDEERGVHPRARAHGRGDRRRDRPTTSSGRATGSSFPSTSIACECRQCKLGNYAGASAADPTATPRWRPRSSATRRLVCSATPILAGRLRRRPGRISPRADGGRRAHESAGRDVGWRGSALPDGHFFPTGYQAAEQAGTLAGGEIVAIWGTGPVGLFAIQSAKVLGAERIIAIETVPERDRHGAKARLASRT